MVILNQLGIILTFGFAGEILSHLLPRSLPSSVLGMLLMLVALRTGFLKPERVGNVAGFFTVNMAFFFLPSAVNVLQNYDMLRPVLFKIFIICLISTVITFLATYFAVRLIQMLTRSGGNA